MIHNNLLNKTLVIGIIVLFFGASVTPSISGDIERMRDSNYSSVEQFLKESSVSKKAVTDELDSNRDDLFSDDFEDGTLNKWNIISGDWEVISESGDYVAHLKRSSTHYRRIVSKATVTDDVIITVKVKGDCDPEDLCADMAVGFYSNGDGDSCYIVCLGASNDKLMIGRFYNGAIDHLVIEEILSENNVWYNVKIKLENGNIYAKRWEVGDSEPSGWQISYSDATIYGHHIVVGGLAGQNDEEFWFDDIIVTGSESGLVAYWKFDEGSGNTAYDSAGDNDGTIYGATWTTGISGYALDFDGSNDYVYVESPVRNQAPYSVCAWVKPTSIDPVKNRYIIANGGETRNSYGFYMLHEKYNDGSWEFGGANTGADKLRCATTSATSTDWTFLVGTWDGDPDPSHVKLYVNAELKATGISGSWYTGSPRNLRIGEATGGDCHFDGFIDEVRIYNKALTEDEIEDLYNIENQPPSADFTWTPINPDPGETVTFDASDSYDPDGTIELYEWDWDNDGEFDESHTNPTATHSWSNEGDYPVTLRVTDDDGATDTETKTVYVGYPPFNPLDWMQILMDLTGAEPVWNRGHWSIEIPFNTNYIPKTDQSVRNVDVSWPFNGDYLFIGDYSAIINGKYYPDNFYWEIYDDDLSSSLNIEVPIIPGGPTSIYLTFTLDWDGWDGVDWNPDKSYLEGGLNYAIFDPPGFTVWLGPFPITIKINIDGAGSLKNNILSPANWIINNDIIDPLSVYIPSGHFSLEFTIKGGLGIDLGWNIRIGIGVGGSAGLYVQVTTPLSASLCGSLFLYANCWIFEAKLIFWEDCWPDYTIKSINGTLRDLISSDQYLPLDSITWELIPRDYGDPQWTDSTLGILANEVFPIAEPTIDIDNEGHKIIAWAFDDKNKEQINGLEIQYSIFDGNSWSEPKFVTEDNLFEFYPSIVYLDNGDALCVFNFLPEDEINSPDEFFSEIETGFSYYNHQIDEWSPVNLIADTPENMDLRPVIAAHGNNAVVIWTTDSDNDLFTIDDISIYTSFWDDNEWIGTQKIIQDNIIADRLDITYNDEIASVCYSFDKDGNLSTVNDVDLKYITFDQLGLKSEKQITNDDYSDLYPSIEIINSESCIAWIKQKENTTILYYYNIDENEECIVVEGKINNPTIIKNGDTVNPYIGWKDFDNETLYVSYKENDNWQTKQVYKSDRYLDSISWILDDLQPYFLLIEKDDISTKTNCSMIYRSYNNEPEKPIIPSGTKKGKVGEEYTYTSSSTDIEKDKIYYMWDWGAGNFSCWIGPINSSEIAEANHAWSEKGTYKIRVKAMDTQGDESEWSDPLSVTIPRGRAVYHSLLLRFFERFPNLFPILRYLLML